MSTSTITIAGNSITLVSLPECPGLKAMEPGAFDPVSTLTSPWTGQVQRQYWPGGDRWSAKCTLPPLVDEEIDDWEAWALQMRGMLCAVQLGFPNKKRPRGNAQGTPVVDGAVSGNNAAGATMLYTKGWPANQARLLLRNDAFQLGYRYYRSLDNVASDASGKAVFPVWPSLREQPADGAAIVLNQPKALWGLAANSRNWGLRLPMVMDFSFDLIEYR